MKNTLSEYRYTFEYKSNYNKSTGTENSTRMGRKLRQMNPSIFEVKI
jgi:hypothetical protein